MSELREGGLEKDFQPYQYSILRYTHDLALGEFVNVGILLMLPENGNVYYRVSENYGRISSFFKDFDGARYREMVAGMQTTLNRLSASNDSLFSRDQDDLNELIAEISHSPQSCFSWSSPRGGISGNPRLRLGELFEEMVEYHQGSKVRSRMDEKRLRRIIMEALIASNLAQEVDTDYTVSTPDISHSFTAAWKNGKIQVLEPVSFDFKRATDVERKATQWRGLIDTLAQREDFGFSALVAPPSFEEGIDAGEAREDLGEAFQKAINILEGLSMVRKIMLQDEIEDFTDSIQKDINQR
jgi:hypothetical protein